MKEIKLTQGQVAFVDDKDFEFLNQWKWFAQKAKNTFYAAREIKTREDRKLILMHRFIMNTPSNLQVDHIDHNGLNNQSFNLRNCTLTENRRNKKPYSNTSYKGVAYHKTLNLYAARIYINKRLKHIGYFQTAIEAATAYDKIAKEYFKEYAYLNFK